MNTFSRIRIIFLALVFLGGYYAFISGGFDNFFEKKDSENVETEIIETPKPRMITSTHDRTIETIEENGEYEQVILSCESMWEPVCGRIENDVSKCPANAKCTKYSYVTYSNKCLLDKDEITLFTYGVCKNYEDTFGVWQDRTKRNSIKLSLRTGLIYKENLCEKFEIEFGDGTKKTIYRSPNKSCEMSDRSYGYRKPGLYEIKLIPYFMDGTQMKSISRKIEVVDIDKKPSIEITDVEISEVGVTVELELKNPFGEHFRLVFNTLSKHGEFIRKFNNVSVTKYSGSDKDKKQEVRRFSFGKEIINGKVPGEYKIEITMRKIGDAKPLLKTVSKIIQIDNYPTFKN